MITRNQVITIVVWVGAPFVLLLVLILINPRYEAKLFERFAYVSGFSLVVLLLAMFQGLILFAAFWITNRRSGIVEGQRLRRNLPITLLFIATMLLCTLPSFWLVVFYPSMLMMFESLR